METTAGKTLIVDRDIGANKVEGIYKTIQAAINDATTGSTIKISPGLYDESILIKTSGLILEPKERGGEVTI
jgi:pectin methylesterase-like acyl-CoA thioesterase